MENLDWYRGSHSQMVPHGSGPYGSLRDRKTEKISVDFFALRLTSLSRHFLPLGFRQWNLLLLFTRKLVLSNLCGR
jgi:hypothetical protein